MVVHDGEERRKIISRREKHFRGNIQYKLLPFVQLNIMGPLESLNSSTPMDSLSYNPAVSAVEAVSMDSLSYNPAVSIDSLSYNPAVSIFVAVSSLTHHSLWQKVNRPSLKVTRDRKKKRQIDSVWS